MRFEDYDRETQRAWLELGRELRQEQADMDGKDAEAEAERQRREREV